MSKRLKILSIEPYYGGSHRAWVDGYAQHSEHDIELLTMPAQFWKWRMQGGAVTMARLFSEMDTQPEIIIASDMMDLSIFRAITRTTIPIVLYFHENQLSYPQNSRQKHGFRYGFINYASAMAAEVIFFNSEFHMANFFEELLRMLKHFADYNELETIEMLREKASVLPLGLDLGRFDNHKVEKDEKSPLILWNHRWEEDKNPQAFLDALYTLADEGFDFRVALAGENFRQEAKEFEMARKRLGERIIHYGFADSFADYARLLWQSDYIISTSYQDFFGISVTEAIYCACVPLLAKRLNYPHLLPEAYHSSCLFRDGALTGLLRQYLLGNFAVDTEMLQKHIAQYDWATMVNLYDSRFEKLAHSSSSSPFSTG